MRRRQATLLQGIEEFVLKVRKKFSFSSRWKNNALRRCYRRKGVIVPPVGIIKLVTGNYDVDGFIIGGQFTAEHIRNTLKQSQTALADQRSILDFGCGCGRVLSQLKYPQTTELHGCDYNPKLIKWCNKLVPSAKLAVNHLAPPLPYDSGKFDFIYAISTFTHWSVALQKQWIAELTRVLSPAGLLLITTHGESYRNEFLKAEQRDSFDKGEPVVRRPGRKRQQPVRGVPAFVLCKKRITERLSQARCLFARGSFGKLRTRHLSRPQYLNCPSCLLHRLVAEQLGHRRHLRLLLRDRFGEFGGVARADDLTARRELGDDARIAGDGLDVGGDLVAHRVRNSRRAKQAHQPIEIERGITGFRRRRHVGDRRRPFVIGDRQQLDLTGQNLRAHDRASRHVNLDAVFGEIGDGRDRIFVGHFGHGQADRVQISGEHEVGEAGGRGPVQLTGLGARHRLKFLERVNAQGGRHTDCD